MWDKRKVSKMKRQGEFGMYYYAIAVVVVILDSPESVSSPTPPLSWRKRYLCLQKSRDIEGNNLSGKGDMERGHIHKSEL